MAHIKSLKSLEKEFASCSHHCSESVLLPRTEREIYTAPLDLEFPVLSPLFFLFFKNFTPQVVCFSEDLGLCSLKSLFPVLVKEKQFKKTEGRRKKGFFFFSPSMKFDGT